MSNVTIKDIAKHLNLSISTVSRALKNHPDIAYSTKVRVKELADTLDYEPNLNAINLRAQKNKVFGIILPSISAFFYHSFISAIEEEASANGYSVIILQTGGDTTKEVDNIKILRQNRVAGVFACLHSNNQQLMEYNKFKELDIPVIFFDKVPETDTYSKVCVADEACSRLATELLVKKGRKNLLAVFGPEDLLITQKRKLAFEEIAQLHKTAYIIIYASSSQQAAEEVNKNWYNAIDGIYCMSDEVLIGALKEVTKRNLKWPTDISIVSISNGEIPNYYYPSITYVETSGYKLGKLAYNGMLATMQGGSFAQDLTTEAYTVQGGSL
jgi:LacI family transcriptional regulator